MTFNPSLASSVTNKITGHRFQLTSHMQFYYNYVLLDWYDGYKNAAKIFHTLVLRTLHFNDLKPCTGICSVIIKCNMYLSIIWIVSVNLMDIMLSQECLSMFVLFCT